MTKIPRFTSPPVDAQEHADMLRRQKPARRDCPCPLYCRYCGRPRSACVASRIHYCKTKGCQWALAYFTCDRGAVPK